jgi:hypothetical protein
MSENNKEVATIEKNEPKTLVAKFDNEEMAKFDISAGAMIPETAAAKPLPVRMNVISWAPDVGETKDFVLRDFGFQDFPSLNPAEAAAGVVNKVWSAFLLSRETRPDGTPYIEQWSVSAKRLVSSLEMAFNQGFLIKGNAKTAARITLKGKVKNKTNSFSCDSYDVEIIVN